jgi:death-on-curing protein
VKEPLWIDAFEALLIHERLVALYGGPSGIRDTALLESALARSKQIYSYGTAPSVVEMAAVCAAGIIRNHPFVDGNKRTGFVIGVLLLEMNGYRFTASEEDAAQAVLALAAGSMSEESFAAWLGANVRRK